MNSKANYNTTFLLKTISFLSKNVENNMKASLDFVDNENSFIFCYPTYLFFIIFKTSTCLIK